MSITPKAAEYSCGRGYPVLDLRRPSRGEDRCITREVKGKANLCTLEALPIPARELLLTDSSFAYSSFTLSSEFLKISDIFTVSLILPFPECHIIGIAQHIVFTYWSLSLSNVHLSFSISFHVS